MTQGLAGGLLKRSGGRWPAVVAVLCAATGCLIPQDDTRLEGVPAQKNRPPRIVESQVQPTERIIRDFGAGGRCELTFEVAVEDPDVDDSLLVYWFLDSTRPEDQPLSVSTLTPTGQPVRSDRGTFRVNLASANSPLSEPGLHLVEALVADTALVDRKPFEPKDRLDLDDGGVVYSLGYVVSYAWTVSTVQGDCR